MLEDTGREIGKGKEPVQKGVVPVEDLDELGHIWGAKVVVLDSCGDLRLRKKGLTSDGSNTEILEPPSRSLENDFVSLIEDF